MTNQEKAKEFLEKKRDADYHDLVAYLAFRFNLTPNVVEDKIREIAQNDLQESR